MIYRLFLILALIAGFIVVPAQASENNKDGSKQKLKEQFGLSQDSSKDPLSIKSDSLTLDSKERIFSYKDNVEIVRGELTITSNLVKGFYDQENHIQNIVCDGNVVITKGPDMKASANKAFYSVKDATVELTEGPELINKGNALTADRITIFLNEDRSEAHGEVQVKVINSGSDGNLLSTDPTKKGDKKKN